MSKILWVDMNLKPYKAEDISDDYLRFIIDSICEGEGMRCFIDNVHIDNLFEEVYKRHLYRADITFVRHVTALYKFGYTDNAPRLDYKKM